MERHDLHAVVEITDKSAEKAESFTKAIRAIAASEAFRRYDWIRSIPIKNRVGNFRGMVVSRRWAATFHFAEEVLKPIEKIALVAGLADNIYRAHDRIQTIIKSDAAWDLKASRLSVQISAIITRTLTGFIPASAHMLATSLSGYCQMAGLVGSERANEIAKRIGELDARFTSSCDKWTDGDSWSAHLEYYLVIK